MPGLTWPAVRSSNDPATKASSGTIHLTFIEPICHQFSTSGEPGKSQETDGLPNAGDDFLDFTLIHELGHGTFGRVFLARQHGLSDRPVVLKITSQPRGEPQKLARLQHTNIVPVYSVHRLGTLHAICMPYFGCTTLEDLLREVNAELGHHCSGKSVVSAIRHRQSTVRSALTHAEGSVPPHQAAVACAPLDADPDLARLEYVPYVDWVLQIGAQLADALAHAHERGIVHRDLKPANVLLADDGQPMILDFNIASNINSPLAVDTRVGGTLPYMSPEQLQIFGGGNASLDGRSDVFTLGVILFQLLTGRHPYPVHHGDTCSVLACMELDRRSPLPSLQAFNSSVTPAIEAIVHRCLAFDPWQRYQSARDLQTDLQLHRANLPLLHAPNRSLVERLKKWRRRNAWATSVSTLAGIGAAAVFVLATASVRLSLAARQRELDERRHSAMAHLAQFREQMTPAQQLLSSDDAEQVAAGIERGQTLLEGYNALSSDRWLEENPLAKHLPPDDRAQLKSDVGALAYLLGRAHVLRPGESSPTHESRVRDLSQNLPPGDSPLADPANLNPRGRFLLACTYAGEGRYREALGLLIQNVQADPSDFGSWHLRGHCHAQLGEPGEAVSSFSTCLALRPSYARTYALRGGLFFTHLKNLHQARADLDRAVQLDPETPSYRIDRALVLNALGKSEESLADLDQVIESGTFPSRLWFIRAEVRRKLGDKAGAAHDLAEGLRSTPADMPSWVARGLARLEANPHEALADFQHAEKASPRAVEPLINQAYVLGEVLRRTDDALAVLDRLKSLHPQHVNGRGGRAVLLARMGRKAEALEEARACLQLSKHPENQYRVGCVFALCADGDPALLAESRRCIAHALLQGWGYEHLPMDADLTALRRLPEFQQVVKAAQVLGDWKRAQ